MEGLQKPMVETIGMAVWEPALMASIESSGGDGDGVEEDGLLCEGDNSWWYGAAHLAIYHPSKEWDQATMTLGASIRDYWKVQPAEYCLQPQLKIAKSCS